MATYAIGDVQGCLQPLENLLQKINFSQADKLWFTGDLVNRGPQSLATLRYIKNLGAQQQIVLGNHDLHLLACAQQKHVGWPEDTLTDILTAPDRIDLLEWLSAQPLLHHDAKLGFTLVHAGFAAHWDLATAQRLAKEVETVLQSEARGEFLQHMYGNQPNQWDEKLTGWERLRCITNYLTRARFCHPDGSLELKTKENINPAQTHLLPWFKLPERASAKLKIIFGHWAALGGITETENIFALDTGCVWGFCLTAMRLEDGKRFSVACKKN